MRLRRPSRLLVALASLLLLSSAFAAPEKLSIAAAANLVHALDALHAEFKRTAPDVTLQVTTAASGTLFAQLKHGAPFDVFLSADTDYPQRAVAENLAAPASLRTFARGRLVLWTTRRDLDITDLAVALRSPALNKLAIAQPRTAPYGRAAEAVLRALDLWSVVAPKLVLGESISQTAQFVETGNADAGLVALSLVLAPRLAQHGRWHEVPPELYASVPLDHAAVLTTRGAKNSAAQRYLDFLTTPPAQKILHTFGYR